MQVLRLLETVSIQEVEPAIHDALQLVNQVPMSTNTAPLKAEIWITCPNADLGRPCRHIQTPSRNIACAPATCS